MEVKGIIIEKLEKETGETKAGKSWVKQSIVIDNGDQYNPLVCVTFFGEEKVAKLASFNKGNSCVVEINLSSREYNGKYYHNIDGWKIAKVGEQAPVAEEDDLPF